MSAQLNRASAGGTALLLRAALTVLAVSGMAVAWPSAASAQGFFQAFFGSFQQPPFQSMPPRTQAYADPAPPAAVPAPDVPSVGTGRAVAYCVRLCDGRYFPIQRIAQATPIQLCNALCPASKTKVFSGGEIHGAVGTDGSRYVDLANAFVYRDRMVTNCTCNGKDAFGLAPIDIAADPTLRAGDVVTTENGLMAVTPKKGQIAAFTPVDKSSLSAEARRRFSAVSVAPGH